MTQPAYVFPHAAIATPHYLASVAGLQVLLEGGNAADAAVAANLVLAVVCPHLCGAGGDLFAIVFHESRVHGLNSSGRLPKAAKLPDDGKVPSYGIRSATVPGAVAGWLALLERFGTKSIEVLAAPAIRLAREGFWPSPSLVSGIERSRALLEQDPEAKRIFLSDPPLSNPELADILEDLSSFYTEKVALNAPEPFTVEDFGSHQAEWVDPPRASFAGVEVYEMPPNSRGHLALKAIEGLTDKDPEFHLRMIKVIEAAATIGDTIYLCVHDEHGMAVSLNESNAKGFGSGVVIPGTGVHLHNRGAYFSAADYIGGERPIHTLAPAMALEGGRPKLVFGTMGGEAQIQIHLQLLARIFLLGQDPAEAVSAPRWVKRPDDLLAEEGLTECGARVTPTSGLFGHAHAILVTEQGLAAASDPRCDGLAVGY